MGATPAHVGAVLCLLSASLMVGCAAPVEVWPPDWHPASAQARGEPPPPQPAALTSAEPVDAGDEGSVPPGAGAGRHHHHGHAAPGADPPVAAAYACPMHPEVTSNEPGECPKCGMDLVKKPARGDK